MPLLPLQPGAAISLSLRGPLSHTSGHLGCELCKRGHLLQIQIRREVSSLGNESFLKMEHNKGEGANVERWPADHEDNCLQKDTFCN